MFLYVRQSTYFFLDFSILTPPLEIHNLYFGKHNKGDKSYKFMLQYNTIQYNIFIPIRVPQGAITNIHS